MPSADLALQKLEQSSNSALAFCLPQSQLEEWAFNGTSFRPLFPLMPSSCRWSSPALGNHHSSSRCQTHEPCRVDPCSDAFQPGNWVAFMYAWEPEPIWAGQLQHFLTSRQLLHFGSSPTVKIQSGQDGRFAAILAHSFRSIYSCELILTKMNRSQCTDTC